MIPPWVNLKELRADWVRTRQLAPTATDAEFMAAVRETFEEEDLEDNPPQRVSQAVPSPLRPAHRTNPSRWRSYAAARASHAAHDQNQQGLARIAALTDFYRRALIS